MDKSQGSWQLTVGLDPQDEPITAIEVRIRPGQGVSFQRSFGGVNSAGPTEQPLSAHDYGYRDESPGLKPGASSYWWAHVDDHHQPSIVIDAVCHRGEETWPVVVTAEVCEENETIHGNFFYRPAEG